MLSFAGSLRAFKDGVEVGRAEGRREMRKLLGIKEDGNG